MKKLLFLFLLLTVFSTPVFADGGIPIWGLTVAHMLALPIFWIVLPFLFAIVVFVETIIFKIFFRDSTFDTLLKLSAIANLITTIIGAIIVWIPKFLEIQPVLYKKFVARDHEYLYWSGPWAFWGTYSLLFSNILLFFVSYIIEYYYVKAKLRNQYNATLMKIALFVANIATYSIPLILYSLLCINDYKNGIYN